MSKTISQTRWVSHAIGGENYRLLNLDHPDVERRILDEMSAGISVYYDRRWQATDHFAEWILNNPGQFRDKRILIVGAGIGLETAVLGRLCGELYINDLAPVALELCQEQLAENGVPRVNLLPGRIEILDLPDIDLIVACYFVYNRETGRAIRKLVDSSSVPILLVNESLAEFQRLLANLSDRTEDLFTTDGTRAILVSPP